MGKLLGLPNQRCKKILMGVMGWIAVISIAACNIQATAPQATLNPSPLPAIASAQASLNTLDRILSSKQVRVAVSQDFPPFGSFDSAMQPQGYDVEVAQMLAADLQVELQLIPVTSDRRIPALLADEVDVVIANLGADPQRAKSIYFSKAYAPFYSGIYGTDQVNAASSQDLNAYRVGVTEGSLEDAALTQKAPRETQINRYKTNALTIAALLDAKVDAIATSNIVATKLIQDNPTKTIGQKFIMQNSPCYIGIKRGDLDFLQWLNVFVTSKKLSGELDAIAEKWFGEPLGDLPS